MQISALHNDQIEEACAVWNEAAEAQGEGYEDNQLSSEHLLQITEDENFMPTAALVITEGGEVIGFAVGYIQTVDFRKEGDLEAKPARLAGVAIARQRWRQGIGRELLQAVEAVVAGQKDAIAHETYGMPLSLVRRIYLDSGPYRFLSACGYRPVHHELLLRNDLQKFQLTDEISRRRDNLEGQGVEYRFYQPEDRSELLDFMVRCFPGGWYASIERATEDSEDARVLMAIAEGKIVGFMGPLWVIEAGEAGGFGSPGVDPDFRGRGIGKVMFNLGLDYLKKAGAAHTTYGTGVTNPARFIYFDSGAELVNIFCSNFRKILRA